MKRYDSIPIQNRWDGKRVYKTTYYPPIRPATTDVEVISKETDYLDTLAYRYYGDPTLYWIIGNANNLGKGRMSVPGGITLRIPTQINQLIDQFNRMNA